MYPLKLKPALKDYIWGGNKLKKDFDIATDNEIVAEAWELSTHKDGNSIVQNGEFAGKTLSETLKLWGLDEHCPVLIKLIDAKNNLSVQVHPNDEYALKVENSKGKTEMWYIVDCEPDSKLVYGFKNDITKEEFRQRIENNTIMDVLNDVPVKKGDVFFIEAGTIHAIGSGIIIAEIQQNSNITYRVYDYGRLGTDGKPRDLHIDKAIEVTNCNTIKNNTNTNDIVKKSGYDCILLAKCKFFTVEKLNITVKAELEADDKSFNSVLILDGKGIIKYKDISLEFKKGDSFYMPKNMGEYIIEGQATVILTKL